MEGFKPRLTFRLERPNSRQVSSSVSLQQLPYACRRFAKHFCRSPSLTARKSGCFNLFLPEQTHGQGTQPGRSRSWHPLVGPKPAAWGQRTRSLRSQQGSETRTQTPPVPLSAPALLATPAAQTEPGETEAVLQIHPPQGLTSHWTRCRGQHTSQESFPAPALGQGSSEEAEQHSLCYTKFPTETMLVLAHIPFRRLNPQQLSARTEPPPSPGY